MPDDKDHMRVTVRVPSNLVAALERLAVEEDRTLSAEIRRLIRLRVKDSGGSLGLPA